MNERSHPYEAILSFISAVLMPEFRDKRGSFEYHASLQNSMLTLLHTLGFFTSEHARKVISEAVAEIKKTIMTDPEYGDAVVNMLEQLVQEPTSDPSEVLVRKVSTLPPPPAPEEEL